MEWEFQSDQEIIREQTEGTMGKIRGTRWWVLAATITAGAMIGWSINIGDYGMVLGGLAILVANNVVLKLLWDAYSTLKVHENYFRPQVKRDGSPT